MEKEKGSPQMDVESLQAELLKKATELVRISVVLLTIRRKQKLNSKTCMVLLRN